MNAGCADPGPQEEDELYEMYMAETNKVYRVQDDTLVPHQDAWGATPRHSMLNSNEVRPTERAGSRDFFHEINEPSAAHHCFEFQTLHWIVMLHVSALFCRRLCLTLGRRCTSGPEDTSLSTSASRRSAWRASSGTWATITHRTSSTRSPPCAVSVISDHPRSFPVDTSAQISQQWMIR